MKCCGYLLCESIDISNINSIVKYKHSAILKNEDDYCFIFPYGAIVLWGSGNYFHFEEQLDAILHQKLDLGQRLIDEFDVHIQDNTKLIHEDIISLPTVDLEIMLSISHGIAQSLRLSYLEDDILRNMKLNRQIILDLANNGKIRKSKKEISKLQGDLYLQKSKMSFEYSILDKPEFFWVYPEYDELYNKTSEYLELSQRIKILEKKFQTIDEILSILSNEINHRHSSRLEWIIIILIFIEIIIFFLQDVFKLI